MATHKVNSKKHVVVILTALIAALLVVLCGVLWTLLVQSKQESNAELSSLLSSESSLDSLDNSTDSIDSADTSSIEPEKNSEPSDSSETQSDSSASEPESEQTSSSEPDKSDASESASETDTENSSDTPAGLISSKVVPKSEKADPSYLDDAVFIGDFISVSLSLYQAVPAQNVIATQNVNLYQVIDNQKVFATPKGKVSLKTALANKNPGKIYIMLGANGMNSWSNQKQISYFSTLLDQLEEWYPDALIYVESMTPVSAKKNQRDSKINNTSINDYNKKLLQMVESRGNNVYYLNVAESFKTKYGNLKADYNGGDGLHFSPAAAKAVVSYALSHTVQE